MWPFRKPPEPPPASRYATTALQVGDDCVCVNDRAHDITHQKLLILRRQYVVREVYLGRNENGYGGPFVKVHGVTPINDTGWDGVRFEKVVAKTIVDEVKKDAGLDIEKERADAY